MPDAINESTLTQLIADLTLEVRELRSELRTKTKPLLTVAEVAELTGRAPYTVRRWITDGILHADRVAGTGPKGRLLIARDQVMSLVRRGKGSELPDLASS